MLIYRLAIILGVLFGLPSMAQAASDAADIDPAFITPCLDFMAEETAPLAEQNRQPARAMIVSPRLACWDGALERDGLEPIADWARQASIPPVLVIRSGGGDSEASIDLARALNAANGQTIVVGVCASACANYLYAGMKQRSVWNQAAILFHGGYTPKIRAQARQSLEALLAENAHLIDDAEAEVQRVMAEFDAAQHAQDDLLAEAGVSDLIIYDYDRVALSDVPQTACTGVLGLERRFIVFGAGAVQTLGLTPSGGSLITDIEALGGHLHQLGAQFSVCEAPTGSGLFEPDLTVSEQP
jgi:hypothetical protein